MRAHEVIEEVMSGFDNNLVMDTSAVMVRVGIIIIGEIAKPL